MSAPLRGQFPAPRVLVVEDDPFYRKSLQEPLLESGYAVEGCADGQEALVRARVFRPDVVVTDWEMPKMDGITLCRILKSIEELRFTHVIILSSRGETSAKVTGLDTGADDYLVKPVDPNELLARVRAGLRLQQALAELAARNELLAKLALTDPLTGLPNRRAFEESLSREVALAIRHVRPLSLLLLDLDHFKRVNDTFGHPAGDEVLASLGLLLGRQGRRGDVVARIGGEEFAVVLPETGKEQAAATAERIRIAVSSSPLGARAKVPVTVSIGVASLPQPCGDLETLVSTADAALYAAKSAGRDRVGV
jgi:two-component system, cell cycle response regulator